MSQVDGVSDIAKTCQLCGERAYQRNDGLCHHFYLGESCPPPALALMQDNLVHPCVSGAF